MFTIEEVWEAQEKAYGEVHPEGSDDVEPTSFRWGFERGVDWCEEKVIEKAVEYIKKDWFQMMVYDYNCYGGGEFNLDKTIERFKQAIKGE